MHGWPITIASTRPVAPDLVASAHEAVRLEARRADRATDWTILEVTQVDDDVWRLALDGDEPLPGGAAWEGGQLWHARDPAEGDGFRATILEVDDEAGCVYVEGSKAAPPAPGPCRVQPYAFLAALMRLLSPESPPTITRELGRRLALADGAEPRPLPASASLPATWDFDWSLLWGPPGTGKTTTLADVLLRLLDDPGERVLVLSTTNRAVDDVAHRVALRRHQAGRPIDDLRRLGRVLDPARFRDDRLDAVLPIRDPAVAQELEEAESDLAHARTAEARLAAHRRVRELRQKVPTLRTHALTREVRCAVTTLHAALSTLAQAEVQAMLVDGRAPFTTVVVDEAGLVSRAHAAAVSLWASRRVVFAGDPRQLSPIVTTSRSMPRGMLRWLARSPLDHLTDDLSPPHVQRLTVQHRMHPAIRDAVSAFAYGGALTDGASVVDRPWPRSATLAALPRATWYVLDEHHPDRPAAVNSQRGPDGASRVRPLGIEVLDALFVAQPELRDMSGLVVTPFTAHGAAVRAWFKQEGLTRWRASTVHAQQGAEAAVVVVDTVHASSTGWPPDEWKRLVNVGMSRAQQLLLVLASRAEMRQPWLAPLARRLTPRVLRPRGDRRVWETVGALADAQAGDLFRPARILPAERPTPAAPDPQDTRLGAQIARRRVLRPVLSHEQAALVHRDLSDAGPRVVRGVAGSGKSLVLAHWAVRALRGLGIPRVTIVHANQALAPLLEALVADAWAEATGDDAGVPWERVEVRHVGALLRELLHDHERAPPGEDGDQDVYDYEHQAERVLVAQPGALAPRFDALFVDESQDLGHAPLDLLIRLTAPGPDGRRAVMLFHDNAQNVFARGTPRWRDLGLDVRGRTDVMRESFRSTRPCVELGLDLLDRLQPLASDEDFRELMRPSRPGAKALLRVDGEGPQRRWRAGFCDVEGEAPEVQILPTRKAEAELVAERLLRWVRDEGVDPRDIVVIAMRPAVRDALAAAACRALAGRAEVHTRTHEGFARRAGVVVTTPHSFKGHDAEVVVVAAVDGFHTGARVLTSPLWVALTRARTTMLVTAVRDPSAGVAPQRLLAALDEVVAARES